MNALQEFIQSKPMGFLTEADMPELIKLDRLFPVLVRCGGCRFTCGAQYLEHLMQCIKAGGDYVRDVSFPVGSWEKAAGWRPEVTAACPSVIVKHYAPSGSFTNHPLWNESDCGGVFDGNTVTSDADPGL